ncbi:DUF2147 domain-containing protein [bacterium]|nr:DUF2147 domain-containing protein [bacterium]
MKLMSFLLTTGISLSIWAQSSPVGRWTTIDDETKKPKSIVEIFEKDGVLFGKIEKLFRAETEDQNPKCDKCSGDKKDQFILGMQILNGLKKDSETKWSGGEILDPKNGKTYSCKIELIEDGKKLKLRGFIGFSLLGRTQVWEREEAPVVAEPAPVESAPAAAPEKTKKSKKK